MRETYDLATSNKYYQSPDGRSASQTLCGCFKNCNYDFLKDQSDTNYYKNIKQCVSNCYSPVMTNIMSIQSKNQPIDKDILSENIDNDSREMHSIIQNKGNCGIFEGDKPNIINYPVKTPYDYTNPYDPSEILPIYSIPQPSYDYPFSYPYYPEGNYLSYGPWGYDQGVYYPDRRSTRPLYGNDRHDRHKHDRHKHEKRDQSQKETQQQIQQAPWQQTQQQTRQQIQQAPLQQTQQQIQQAPWQQTQQQAPWQQTQQQAPLQQTQQVQRQKVSHQKQQAPRQQVIQQIQPQSRHRTMGSRRRREDYFEKGNKEKENTVCLTHEDHKKLFIMAHK